MMKEIKIAEIFWIRWLAYSTDKNGNVTIKLQKSMISLNRPKYERLLGYYHNISLLLRHLKQYFFF